MASINNVKIGVARLTYKGLDLGHTKDGVVFKLDRKFADVTVDQYGDTPIDKVLTGQSVTVEVQLAEASMQNLNLTIPEAADALGSPTTNERLGLGVDAGYSLRQDAGLLTIHPIANATSDDSQDIQIYKAVSSDPIELPFKVGDQKVFKVVFTGLVDETYASGRRLGHIGPVNIS